MSGKDRDAAAADRAYLMEMLDDPNKIAEFEKQLLALATPPSSTAATATSTATFSLPPMQKRAVPRLHIYPEQDLPVPK